MTAVCPMYPLLTRTRSRLVDFSLVNAVYLAEYIDETLSSLSIVIVKQNRQYWAHCKNIIPGIHQRVSCREGVATGAFHGEHWRTYIILLHLASPFAVTRQSFSSAQNVCFVGHVPCTGKPKSAAISAFTTGSRMPRSLVLASKQSMRHIVH